MLILDYISNTFIMMKTNKLRTFLSMLGIVIWIFAVIVMLAIWQWTQQSVVDRFNSLWADLITIYPWAWVSNVRNVSTSSSTNILDDDVIDFLYQISWVQVISPSITTRKQAIYETNNTNANIVWVIPEYLKLKNIEMANGNWINQENIKNMDLVAVLGNTMATDLFGNKDPIWKEFKLENKYLTVVGVLKSNSQTDSRIFVPSTTMYKLAWTTYYNALDIQITDVQNLDTYKEIVNQSLMSYFDIKNSSDIKRTISNLQEILSSVEEVTWLMKTLLAGIAWISLLVWGIWVMNIMLVSVTERTREIWIRKALWAMKQDIMTQFLIESVILTFIAWAIWVLISFGVVNLINPYITSIITPNSVIVASVSSVCIWIMFGILPAYKWANLKVIDALRYE